MLRDYLQAQAWPSIRVNPSWLLLLALVVRLSLWTTSPPASAGSPSATGPSGGGPPTGASGAGSFSVASKGKGNDVAEKEDAGDGNLTAAVNLI
uniref:WGS project CBMI000000000 data, contig CS3069_c002045 n=1 Tax=Fusarium clavum TaxID=2594811 RepID=A0A090MCC8_9HYPO|nr:unnamed protein product [Fusarium clavum]